MKFLLVLFFFGMNVQAFTLVHSTTLQFNSPEITVNVSSDSCTSAGLTTNSLLDMVEEVADEYWNSVSTSAIQLKRGGIVSTSIGALTSLNSAITLTEDETILIGCNTNTTMFPSSSDSIGGVGGLSVSNGVTRGAVYINANGNFSSLSDSQQRAIIAHELGHAIGLGHSSDEVALMYYSVSGKVQEKLSLDDKDGVSYLYPNEDLTGSCGSISYVGDDGQGPFITMLIVMILALVSFSQWRKRKSNSFSSFHLPRL